MSDETPPNEGGTPPNDPPADWRSNLPETFRDAPFIKGAENPDAALVAIRNAAAHMGNSLRIPGEDASPEDRQKFLTKLAEKAPELMLRPDEKNMDQFYNSLGRPESPDKYNLPLEEGEELPSDFGDFAKTAHKYGLTQTQFEGLVKEVVGQQKHNLEVMIADHNQDMAALSQEWGVAFDQNISRVKNFLKLTDAPEGIVDLITENAMSSNEIKWLHSIATATKSPVELVTHSQQEQDSLTPAEAQNRIQEMLNNSAHPYWNASDPRHKDAVRQMVKLQEAVSPSRNAELDKLRA